MEFDQFEEDHLKKLNLIQKFCRKNHIRNEMIKVKDSYEQIFRQIEGDDSDVQVVWPDTAQATLSYPRFHTKANKINDRTFNVNGTKRNKFPSVSTVRGGGQSTSALRSSSETPSFPDLDNDAQLSYLKSEHLATLDKAELLGVRENVSLEMMWIHQAIQSRVQYLKLKRSLHESKTSQSQTELKM